MSKCRRIKVNNVYKHVIYSFERQVGFTVMTQEEKLFIIY
jgi:hypothetical protein